MKSSYPMSLPDQCHEEPSEGIVQGTPKDSLCVLYWSLMEMIDLSTRLSIMAHQPWVDVRDAKLALSELHHTATRAHALFQVWHEDAGVSEEEEKVA